MNEENVQASSDLIRWLKLLALPGWAKVVLAGIMLFIIANALALLLGGWIERDKDAISAAVSILTFGLPLGLIVVALVFGDGGSRKLRQLTHQVLEREVPTAIRENLAPLAHGPLANATIEPKYQGFIADYTVSTQPATGTGTKLHFRLELNVRKVNLVYWADTEATTTDARRLFESHPGLHSCLVGAEREGYVLNPVLQSVAGDTKKGCVFIKTFHEDFLLSPAQRLYFAQDLSFFVRGLLEASIKHG
jgi:hypothetical protein